MADYQRQLITTNDGSSSLFIPEMNETYHSTKGAQTESLYIYIQHGLDFFLTLDRQIEVLEIGMGTGLNVLLAYEWSLQQNKSIHLNTLEPYPIPQEQIEALNYTKGKSESTQEIFKQIHNSSFAESHALSPGFTLTKWQEKLEDFTAPKNKYDVVFYDAFAPSKQAEIWNVSLLQKVYDSMQAGAVLTTYCAQGQFKRDLRSIGFEVQNPPGPMGKKEMTLAWKK